MNVVTVTPNIGLILIIDNDSNAIRSLGDVFQGPERDSLKHIGHTDSRKIKLFSNCTLLDSACLICQL